MTYNRNTFKELEMSKVLVLLACVLAGAAFAGNLQSNVVQEAECRVCAWDAIAIKLPPGENEGGDGSPILLVDGSGIVHYLISRMNGDLRYTLTDGHPEEGGRILHWPDPAGKLLLDVRFYDSLWVWPHEDNPNVTPLVVTYRSE